MSTCTQPGAVTDWELEAFLDGAASERVAAHLQRCAHCADQLEDLKRLGASLRASLARVDCPAVDVLRAYTWRRLDPAQQAEVAQHLAVCQACASEVAVFLGPAAGQADPRAAALPASPGSILDAVEGAVRRGAALMARLIPPALSAAPALRGADSPARVYQVDETGWELALSSTAESSGYSLTGQLLGPDPDALAGARVSLHCPGQLTRQTTPDDTGWFGFQDLPAAQYRLAVDVNPVTVEIPDLPIGMRE